MRKRIAVTLFLVAIGASPDVDRQLSTSGTSTNVKGWAEVKFIQTTFAAAIPASNNTATPNVVRKMDDQPGCLNIAANGVQDDTAALRACRAAAPAQSIVRLPHGDLKLAGFPEGQATILWQADGTTFNGGMPIGSLGNDIVENVLNGGKWFARGQTLPDAAPVMRIDSRVSNDGGTTGFVVPALNLNCSIPSKGRPLSDFVWCESSVLTSSAIGPGQHVSLNGTAVRPSNALADGLGPRSQTWAGYFENNDRTNVASNLSGSVVGIENDIYANDRDPMGHRIVLQMMISRSNPLGAAARVGYGISMGRNDNVSYFGTPVKINAPFDTAGIDLSAATALNEAPAIKLAAGQNIDLSGDGNHLLSVNSRDLVLQYTVKNVNKLTVDNQGNGVFAGNVTSAGAAIEGVLKHRVEASDSIESYKISNGFNIAIKCNTDIEVLTAKNTIDAGSIALCRSPEKGQFISLLSNITIKHLAFTPVVLGAPVSISVTTPVRLVWISDIGAWMTVS